MRFHATNPKLYLVEPADLRAEPLHELVRADYELLAEAMGWAVSYLTNPHPELGRSGPVCPFTRPAMRKNTFFLTVYHGSDLRQEDVAEVVREYRDWFLEMEPREGKDVPYKTINILFPDISTEAAIELVEATQTFLKAEYVPHGIMIGEFHPGPPKKAGLWNPDFRPLKSPVPLMSIRYMVPTDFAFLRDTEDFMRAYLSRFADRLPAPMRGDIEATAHHYGLEHMLVPPPAELVAEPIEEPVRVERRRGGPLVVEVLPSPQPEVAPPEETPEVDAPMAGSVRPLLSIIAAAALQLGAAVGSLAAQAAPPEGGATSSQTRTYQVSLADAAVRVDGVLDEPVWGAAQAMDVPYKFFPVDGSPTPVRTDCRITFDDENLYFGCTAYDPEPSRIRARYADRDAVREDDHIFLVLDPFNDQRRAFEFGLNALGVQMDATWSEVDGVEDFTWDAIWKSAGRLTPEGYVVEAAIPFSSLRFPDTDAIQTWGVLWARSYPREARYALRSININRNQACLLCQADKLEGFRGVRPGRDVELTPTLTTRRSDVRPVFPAGRMEPGDVDPEFGLSGRWGITPNVNLNATLNPDFSQVEADVAQLEVNERFALSYPEKRPFFLEGADLFGTPTRLVFTRSIVDPTGGLKLTGKEGRNVFGVFAASDRVTSLLFPANQGTASTLLQEDVHTAVARYRRDIGRASTVGATYTGRMGEGYFNHVAAVDGFLRLSPANIVRVQYSFSGTEYPDTVVRAFRQSDGTLTDGVLQAEFVHRSRDWFASALVRDVGEDFRADAGFINRADIRGTTLMAERSVWGGPNRWFNRLGFLGFAEWLGNHDGRETDLGLAFVTNYQGPRQTTASAGLGFNRKLFAGRTFEMVDLRTSFEIRPSRRFAFTVSGRFGEDIDIANARKANLFQILPGLELRVGRSLFLELDHAIRRLNTQSSDSLPNQEILDARLTEARAVYHFGVRTFVRAIVQYQGLNQDPSLYRAPVRPETNTLFGQLMFAHKVNPQTVLFVGYTDNRLGLQDVDLTRTGRTFFVKLGYAFRP